jgi:transcriptional regulator with XRE-family HTH domain
VNSGVGAEVRRLRKSQGLSQEILAKSAGLSQSYVGRIETGDKIPTLSALDSVAVALGVTSSELLQAANKAGDQPPAPPKEPPIAHRIAALPMSDQALVLRMIEALEAANRQMKGRWRDRD